MDTVDDHLLLPHLPDWSEPVEWTRSWETGVTDTLDGSEERVAVRPKGRHALRFTVGPYNLAERAALVARLEIAARTGRVAVPFWGRGLRLLAANAGAASVTLTTAPAWRLDPGDPLFFRWSGAEAFDAWEVRRLTLATGAVLILDAPLTRAYPAGTFCWPLLLGHGRFGDLDLRTDWHLQVAIEVRQLEVRPDPAPDLCALALALDGAGDRFDCYAEEDPVLTPLGAGNGWAGAWALGTNPLGPVAWEPFDAGEGEDVGGWNGGWGWAARWFTTGNPLGVVAQETFDPYSAEDPITVALAGGTGFTAPWTLSV